MTAPYEACVTLVQGAEAKLYTMDFHGKKSLVKHRFSKKYRHPQLDKTLTQQRVTAEVRSLTRCRMAGIPVPTVYFVDQETNSIVMEFFPDAISVRDLILSRRNFEADEELEKVCRRIGRILAMMHRENIVHGDLTTSNMLLTRPSDSESLTLIDFGLSHHENLAEHKGVDLYVLERALLSTHPNTERLFALLLQSYEKHSEKKLFVEVFAKLEEVRLRGRKRLMVG